MADHSQKWRDGTSSTNIRSSSDTNGLAAIISKLDNLGRDMKKLKENVYAIQVRRQICKGPHLDKECPLNEEVKQVEEVKYGEFGRPAPFNETNGSKFHVGPPGYYTRTDNRPPYGEKRLCLEELMIKHQSRTTNRAPSSSTGQCKVVNADHETPNIHISSSASVNVMPRNTSEYLRLANIRKTSMLVEIVDMMKKEPLSIIENIIVRINKFLFPLDFVIIDKTPNETIILGMPFLATIHAEIDVLDKNISLGIDNARVFRSSSKLARDQTSNPTSSANPTPKGRIHRSSKQKVENSHFEKHLTPVATMTDNRTMAEMLRAPTKGTTFSSNSLLEEFTDELALITYPLDYDDNLKCDIESDLKEIEFLLYQGEDSDFKDSIDQTDLANRDDLFVDPTPEMFTDEQPPDYSLPPRFDVYPDDFLEIESDANNFDDDSFDSKGEKIKESKLLIDQLDLPCDILPEYDSFASQDFSRDDDLPPPDNEDKVFNPGILIYEKSVKIITRVAQEKKLAISFASLVFEDFDPPFYELLVFKDVFNSMRLLPFSSENEEKVFKPGIYTSEKVHSCFLPELSHPGYPVFKVNMIFISLMRIFHVQSEKNTPPLDVLLFHFYPP
nr:hypothetical protein [Tanacetum cinerariifolium]